MSRIGDCHLIKLEKISVEIGNLSSVNNFIDVPFATKRIFYQYDIPSGERRGAHAHIECHQALIAITGSFKVLVDDGTSKKEFLLSQPNEVLHIPPGIWASQYDFANGSVCLVLASEVYQEQDYIRDYTNYLNYKNGKK